MRGVEVLCFFLFSVTPGAFGSSTEPTDPAVYQERKDRSWCGPKHEDDPLPGLDDAACAKRFPPLFDRDFHCPSTWPRESMQGFQLPTGRAEDLDVSSELAHLVPTDTAADAKVAIAVLRREAAGAQPLVRFLGNGAERRPHQPWSSSKMLAAAHAAARLRSIQPNLGLDAVAAGTPLADMITIIASYDLNDTRPGVSSNALGAYFHALGGHQDANRYLHEVIGANANESFGGNYGEPIPSSLSYTLQPGLVPTAPVSVPPDGTPIPPINNSMSCLTMAEWLRRIVCVRNDSSLDTFLIRDARFEGKTQRLAAEPTAWVDSAALLYGAPSSALFPGLQWGGLSMGTDIYLQLALNLTAVETRSKGLWRIFSKLGAGISSTAHPGEFEITLNAYGCFPVVADDGSSSVPGRGLEFVLSAAVVGKGQDGRAADAAMRDLVANVTQYLLLRYDGAPRDGRILDLRHLNRYSTSTWL